MGPKCPDCGAELPNDDFIACEACSTIDSTDDPDAWRDECDDPYGDEDA